MGESDLMAEEIPRLELMLSKALADQGSLREATEHVDAVLATPNLPQEIEVEALAEAADVASKANESHRAERLSRRCLECLRRLPNEGLMASAERSLGWALMLQGKYDEAHAQMEHGYHLMERTGDQLTAGKFLSNLGTLYLKRGMYKEANAHFRASLARGEAVGDVSLIT